MAKFEKQARTGRDTNRKQHVQGTRVTPRLIPAQRWVDIDATGPGNSKKLSRIAVREKGIPSCDSREEKGRRRQPSEQPYLNLYLKTLFLEIRQ